jgi:hypothetical protein
VTNREPFRPRLQVDVPDELYEEYRTGDIPSGDQLGEAARAELRRRIALDETEAYLEELDGTVGEPTAEETAIAEAIVTRIAARENSPVR